MLEWLLPEKWVLPEWFWNAFWVSMFIWGPLALCALYFAWGTLKAFIGAARASSGRREAGGKRYGFWRRFASGMVLVKPWYSQARLRRTWEIMRAIGDRLSFRYRKPGDDDEYWYGQLLGTYRDHKLRIGQRKGTSKLQVFVTFGLKIPKVSLVTYHSYAQEDEPALETGNAAFDRYFVVKHAKPEAAKRLRSSPDRVDAMVRFITKWVPRGGLWIDDEEIQLWNGTDTPGKLIPFYPYLPSEQVLLKDPGEIGAAQLEFLDDLVEFAEQFEQTLGDPRYVGIPKAARKRREKLDHRLVEAISDSDEDTDPSEIAGILDEGADVNARNERGQTALMVACENDGRIGIASLLLERGADVKARDEDDATALRIAIAAGAPVTMAALFAKGTDATDIDSEGRTTLIYAFSEWGASGVGSKTVRLLVEAGADVNAVDDEGRSAISIAKEVGDE